MQSVELWEPYFHINVNEDGAAVLADCERFDGMSALAKLSGNYFKDREAADKLTASINQAFRLNSEGMLFIHK
jgi:hypothetical protein